MSLIAWYQLNGNALDSSGNGFNGVPTNVSWVDGKIGQCGSFNTGYISIPNLLTKHSPFSVSFWGRTTSTVNQCFGCSRTIIGNGFAIFILNNNNLRFDTGSQWSTGYIMPVNEWVHIVVTKDNQYKKLYVNGTLYGSTTSIGDMEVLSDFYFIGASHANGSSIGNYFKGNIDDYRIYDHALSPKEVKELAKAKILHYKFNEFQEPTVNVVTNTDLDTGWSKGYQTAIVFNEISPPYGINSPVVGFNRGNASGYWYSYGDYAPQEPNTRYTVSLYVKTLDSNFNIRFYTADNSEIGRYNSEYIKVPNDGEWHRVVWNSFVNSSDSQSDSLSFNFSYAGAIGAANTRTWFCAPQMEAKDHATPFVNGTRTGTVKDTSGYDNHAELALATTPRWVEDCKIGRGAYEFGSGANIESGFSATQINNSEYLTVCCWVNPHQINSGMFIGNQSPSNARLYIALNSNQYRFGIGSSPWTSNISSAVAGQWAFIALVIDFVSNTAKLYINSVLVETRTGWSWTNSTESLILGKHSSSGSYNYDGIIDDVRIYATALSADEVKELYEQRASLDSHGNFYTHKINETKHKPLIVDYTVWEDGQTGSVTGFSQNGSTSENYRILGSDPWGKETVIWEARPDETSGPDGGWNSSQFNIDNTKMYRFSVWIRRTVLGNGSAYLGCRGYGLTNGVLQRDNGVNNTNPYFWNGAWSSSYGSDWVLIVGHIWPAGSGTGSNHSDSGLYYADGTRIGNITRDFVWREETTTALHRAYLYYSTDTSTRQQFCYPRVDICDGTEPSINELLVGFDSRNIEYIRTKGGKSNIPLDIGSKITILSEISEVGITNGLVAWYPFDGNANDISGNKNHGTVYGATLVSGISGQCYSFDGVDDYITTFTDNTVLNSSLSISAWVYPLSAGESYGRIIDKTNNSTSATAGIMMYLNNSPYIIVSLNNINLSSTASSVPYNTWTHLCVTIDNSGVAIIYINGIQNASKTIGLPSSINNVYPFTIGNRANATDRTFDGKIDDVRIYNRVLSAEEIKILYNLTAGNQRMIQTPNKLFVKGKLIET